jgi:hypothetical protein
VNVQLDNGRYLLEDKTVSAFTNEEELLFIPNAKSVFPFLLEDKLIEQGANFNKGYSYLNKISHDGNLITGQNPWSAWAMAEAMVRQLGYSPIHRNATAEENTLNILLAYESKGYQQAKAHIYTLQLNSNETIDRFLLAMHGIVALAQWQVGKAWDLLLLLEYAQPDDSL